MIVFEEKMREIIGLMPCITDANNNKFDVRYDWGTIDVLNKFLLLKENKSKSNKGCLYVLGFVFLISLFIIILLFH